MHFTANITTYMENEALSIDMAAVIKLFDNSLKIHLKNGHHKGVFTIDNDNR